MKNPCSECDHHLSGGDKNAACCEACDARVKYVSAIGGIFGPDARYTKHACLRLPVALTHRQVNGGNMNNAMSTTDVRVGANNVSPLHSPQPDLTRTCNKCGETKPLNEFRKNHTCLHGREPVCRECRNEASRQKTAAARAKRLAAKPPKPENPEDYIKTKVCRMCKQIKPLALFVSNKSCKDGRESICKACRAIYIAQKQAEKLMDVAAPPTIKAVAAAPNPDQLSADMGMPLPETDNSPAPPAEIGDAATDERVEVAWSQPSGLSPQPFLPTPICVPISQNKWLERRCMDLVVAIYSHIDNGETHSPALEGWAAELGRTLRARRLMEKEEACGGRST